MGCNCGKNKARVRYEVKYSTGAPNTKHDTVAQAQAAGKASGAPYTFKAVQA